MRDGMSVAIPTHRMMTRWILAACLLTGCLQSTYHVERSELERLAQLPAKDRGASIRATQDLSLSRVPSEVEVHRAPRAVVGPAVVRRIERNRRRIIRPRRRANVVDARPRSSRERPAVRVRGGDGERPAVRDGEPPAVRVRGPEDGDGERTGVRTRGDGDERARGSREGDESEVSAAAAIGVAVVAAVAVAASVFVVAAIEGTRYDGFVSADPDRSIHLYRRDGQWLSIPVYALEPELAAWADGALLDDEDPGGSLQRIGRAPLDRQGFSMGVEAGVSGVVGPSDERHIGGGARFSLGGFPIQHLGLYGLVDFAAVNETLDIRYGTQLQAFVPPIGIAHLGVYGEVGGVGRRADRPDDTTERDRRLYGGAGALLQLDINTRVALTLRGGIWSTGGRVLPEATLGLTVF